MSQLPNAIQNDEEFVQQEANVFLVAEWFLHKQSMTHKKLQKLCYYAQAWHIALLNRSLFSETIQAWIHGPVIPALYAVYADYGWDKIPSVEGNASSHFKTDTIEVLEAVWNTYKDFDGNQLEALTHSERPWQMARNGIPATEPCENQITNESMHDFYIKLYRTSQND